MTASRKRRKNAFFAPQPKLNKCMNAKSKKILIAILGFFVVLGVALYSMLVYTRSFSPAATASYDQDGVKIGVSYSQPAKKGRTIFGTLLPYNKVWRTGANDATIFEVNRDVQVAGQALKAGKYSLWTIPDQTEWTIIFNAQTGQWGTQYDEKQDVLRVKVPAGATESPQEMFDISLAKGGEGIQMVLAWDVVKVSVPIQ
jgi:Protein of unknown function (DUF2911)